MKLRYYLFFLLFVLIAPIAKAEGYNTNLGIPKWNPTQHIFFSYNSEHCIIVEKRRILNFLTITSLFEFDPKTSTTTACHMSGLGKGTINSAYIVGDSLIVHKNHYMHVNDLWEYPLNNGEPKCLIPQGHFDVTGILAITEEEIFVSGLFGTDRKAICVLNRCDLTLKSVVENMGRIGNDRSLQYFWYQDKALQRWIFFDAKKAETTVLDFPFEYRLYEGQDGYITVKREDGSYFLWNRETKETIPLSEKYTGNNWLFTVMQNQLFFREWIEETQEINLYSMEIGNEESMREIGTVKGAHSLFLIDDKILAYVPDKRESDLFGGPRSCRFYISDLENLNWLPIDHD